MVHFDGSMAHNTIVQSGSVWLLGPFHVQSMMGMGFGGAPTSSPMPAPTVDSDGDGVPDNLDGTITIHILDCIL